jgi:hypothetical protein
MIIGPEDPQIAQVARQMQEREQVHHLVDGFIKSTSQIIYAHLVAPTILMAEGKLDVNVLRELSSIARDAAPYLAESYGMVQIHQKQ